eukprot:Skav214014  [mRNA]  locus=scaffold1070:395394:397842:- [translate_table: standard]
MFVLFGIDDLVISYALEFFRGLFLFIVCLPIYRFGSSFWGEAFAGHYTPASFHAVLTACAATVPGRCGATTFVFIDMPAHTLMVRRHMTLEFIDMF